MPFYEYECASCRFYSEVMQKVSDPPMKRCPSCGRNTMKKLVSAPVFRLKGSGWYETDFKSDKEAKRNLAVDKAEAATTDTAKTDAKPAETKAAEAKPADSKPTETESKRKSVAISRKATPRKAAARKARSKPRPPRKARR
jgi:putative FmdB family regulatory protein